ncbi:unnamed protein product [Acanthoscelides obtectus]|uniref:Integrase catalytic domain-containing protein n=1 Tax=Acanthoscelides obtectus TaxID=200917 RepID=A0A9P0KKB0_ACAOB|nr:unnamed protein product [Acanthoscelides obtectus]CAK1656494.1 hypothetical protein AOBTE_LOCUS19748 [Acanthoscelides obtectus]
MYHWTTPEVIVTCLRNGSKKRDTCSPSPYAPYANEPSGSSLLSCNNFPQNFPHFLHRDDTVPVSIPMVVVKHALNATACPRANGQIERYNRTILNGINTSIENESDWQKALPRVLWGINNTVNDTTGYAPHLLMFGYEKNRHADMGDNEFEVFPDAKKKAKERMDVLATKMKKRFD